MRTLKHFITLTFLFGYILNGFGQKNMAEQNLTYKTGNPADWHSDQDAIIAAPKNHKVILENENVRVLEVTMSPGEVEPVHHHRWPSVLYILEAGDFTDSDGEGNLIMDSRKTSKALQFPMTMYKNPEAPHSVENLSKTKPIKLIRVEMKNEKNSQNEATVDSIYSAFAVGDIPTVIELLDKKIVWNEAEGNSMADGNPYIGPDAVLNGVFARLGEEHEYFNLKDIELHNMYNDKVLVTLRYDAKRKSNGAVYDAQVAHLWTLKNGKVVAFQQYVDTKQLADAANK